MPDAGAAPPEATALQRPSGGAPPRPRPALEVRRCALDPGVCVVEVMAEASRDLRAHPGSHVGGAPRAMLETIHGGTCAGAGRSPAQALAHPPCAPRLPMSVLKEVALIAVARAARPRHAAALLAPTCRAWFVALYGHVLLPTLVLRGAEKLRHFGFSVARNVLGLAALVARHTHTLIVLQHNRNGVPAYLFDGVARTRRFGLHTAELLRMILRRCRALTRLHVQCEPLALDTREGVQGLGAARAQLQELVCLQSPWAGDVIDAIWRPGTPPQPWSTLTHLQLHGPRSRLSVRTAEGLAHLPTLTHLALILPSFVGGHGTRSAAPVLQALVARLPHLIYLLVVGHDEAEWVGATRPIRPALEQLRVCEPTRTLRLTLVTAAVRNHTTDGRHRTHPGAYSDWMFSRAQNGTHWHFADDCDATMLYNTETWDVPYAPRPPPPPAMVHAEAHTEVDAQASADDLWFDAQEAVALAPPHDGPPSPEVWGIDNLA